MGQDREEGDDHSRVIPPRSAVDPLEAELFQEEVRAAVRYERRLALKAALCILLVVIMVYARQRWFI